ncbi:hypothetical protein BACCIP111883_02506 [Sutcliffiella rhizosphaerae]|uniref:DUF2500 domain-containing protein n=2 Tax=Sutcliffiella rhizosphaerae TaxID=2880967 RepID=A0ABN8A9B2_9BACI|nr:hypothetical protein BACCIP111883_02506 [Sutcliffiella rhizosphaerae]
MHSGMMEMIDGFFMGDGFFELFFFIILFAIISVFCFIIFNGLKEWKYNNNQPELTVAAIVVTKRMDVSHSSLSDTNSSSHTTYYVTFQVESGDRMEFMVDGKDYSQIVEEDKGKLNFKGRRFLGFERRM